MQIKYRDPPSQLLEDCEDVEMIKKDFSAVLDLAFARSAIIKKCNIDKKSLREFYAKDKSNDGVTE